MAIKSNPEAIIETIGGCGKFQVLLCIIMHLMKTPTVATMYVLVFSVATPKWWCKDTILYNANTTEAFQNTSFDLVSDGFKTCEYQNNTKCKEIIYDQSMNTIVSEWNMACESSWIPSMIASMQFGGILVGNVLCGQVADTIGRKIPLFMSLISLIVANLIGYFSTGWVVFAVARVLCGLSMGWFLTLQNSIMTETTLSRIRPWVVAMPSWSIETCVFSLIAYLVPDWRKLHLVIALMTVPFLATWCFIPDSFRWYLSHNRRKDARKVIQYIARVNSHGISDDVMDTMLADISDLDSKKTDHKRYTALDLFRTKRLIRITFLLGLNWFALGMVSYSIRFGIQALSGNFFFNTFIFSIITIPLSFVSIWMCNKFGRRYSIIFSFALSAFGGLAVGFVQYIDTDARGSLTNAFAMVATLGIGTAWGPVSTMTVELYPTVVRNIGYGSMHMFARLGSVIAPQLAFLDTKVAGVMYFLCGGLSLLCVLGTLRLTETRGRDLTDRIQKRENQ